MNMMTATECLLHMCDEQFELEDYQSGVPRWCTGCGDNAILAAVQRLCRDEALRPEKTVFVWQTQSSALCLRAALSDAAIWTGH